MIWAAAAALGLAAAFIAAIYFITGPETSPPSSAKPEAPLFQKRTEAPPAPPESAAPPAPGREPPAPAPQARTPTPVPPPAKKAAPAWLFEGKVYDLLSLAPVYEVQISFKDGAGEERGQTSTDSRGRYRVSLEPPAQGGYKISISHPDYKNTYLDEINPPYRTLDEEQRRTLAAAKVYNPPWKGQTSKPTRKDFVLIPNE